MDTLNIKYCGQNCGYVKHSSHLKKKRSIGKYKGIRGETSNNF